MGNGLRNPRKLAGDLDLAEGSPLPLGWEVASVAKSMILQALCKYELLLVGRCGLNAETTSGSNASASIRAFSRARPLRTIGRPEQLRLQWHWQEI